MISKKSPETVCLFVCFEQQEQYYSYLAACTIAGDRVFHFNLQMDTIKRLRILFFENT
jgi:hypothetical protein